jgi:nucleotide-binding universal stress UspA family protein
MLKKILVALDGSVLSERALPYAAELAQAADAALTLVGTADMHQGLHPGLPHLHLKYPSSYVNMHADRLRARGLVVDTVHASGEPSETLVTEIERRQPALVVMSTHGRSAIDRLVHASVTDTVVSRVGCPVMLVRPSSDSEVPAGQKLAGKCVLVPLDGSRFSEAGLPLAVELARALGSDIMLVQAIVPVYQGPMELELVAPPTMCQALRLADAEDAAAAYLNGLAHRLSEGEDGPHVTGVARIGQLIEVIRELSSKAPISLVVMATHHRTGLARALLGGEADAVVRSDDLPVVLVHPHSPELTAEEAFAPSAKGDRAYA